MASEGVGPPAVAPLVSRESFPEACPTCDAPAPKWRRTLRPSGLLGRRAPHTGYENLGHVPYQMPRVRAASAPWQALPDPEMGRLRADPVEQVITLSFGASGCGYPRRV